jgi:hypothetical protein
MSRFKAFALTTLAIGLFCCAPSAPAQISVTFGVEPVCPYGYFDYPPYQCAPYGYYGPDWFNDGIFIGAGHWYHGPAHFSGHVDNRYDPRRGYHGPMPGRGEQPNNNFHGNEARDGQGHVVKDNHDAGSEHSLPGNQGGNHGGNNGGEHGHH